MKRKLNRIFSALLVLFITFSFNVYGQSAPSSEKGMLSLTEMMPTLLPVQDYSGDFSNRAAFLGDFNGARNDLLNDGISFDVELTQVIQSNTHGGLDTNNGLQYSGSVDYYLHFDTAKMNLWPGGLIVLHGETQFGRSVNPKVGSILGPNADALFPVPEDPGETTLSEAYLMQAFSDKLLLLLGKLDGSKFADNNLFAGNYKNQFLNTAFFANPLIFPYAPYTALSAFAVFMPKGNDDVVLIAGVIDSNGTATRSGFDTAFSSPDGISFASEIDIKLNPFNKPGNYRAGLVYTSKEFLNFAQDPRERIQALVRGLSPSTTSDNFVVYVNFDQYFYIEEEDPSQGIGLFGRFGWGDEDDNFLSLFFSGGIGGKGIIKGRDRDTFGLGWYYLDITDNFRLDGADKEQGIELFYNVEVNPWLNITPDIQYVVDPAGGFGGRDNSLVIGVRTQMQF